MNPQIKRCSISHSEVYSKLYSEANSGAYISYLRGKRCKTEDDFFFEVSASFQFPYYFGENWTALDECLCDLEWLCTSRVFVLIDDFCQIFSNQANIQKTLQERTINYFEKMICELMDEQNIYVEVWLNN